MARSATDGPRTGQWEAARGALNAALFLSLQHVFGYVRIDKKGQGAPQPWWATDPRDGKTKLAFPPGVSRGEYYRVNCPYCPGGDRQNHLYVHHLYGREIDGRVANGLAHCFRCHFEKDREHRRDFQDRLDFGIVLKRANIISAPLVRTEVLAEVPWPGEMIRLTELAFEHPALAYLRRRKFDPAMLETTYGVRFCIESRLFPVIIGRFVFPVLWMGKLVGWQARLTYDPPKGHALPKWFTMPGMARSELIYSIDLMRRHRCGALVEGPIDVAAFGTFAGAVLGSDVQMRHLDLLGSLYRDAAAVFVYDEDVREDPIKYPALMQAATQLSAKLAGGCAVVWLPQGKDPGDFAGDPAFLVNYVVREAARQGVQLDFSYKPRFAPRG